MWSLYLDGRYRRDFDRAGSEATTHILNAKGFFGLRQPVVQIDAIHDAPALEHKSVMWPTTDFRPALVYGACVESTKFDRAMVPQVYVMHPTPGFGAAIYVTILRIAPREFIRVAQRDAVYEEVWLPLDLASIVEPPPGQVNIAKLHTPDRV